MHFLHTADWQIGIKALQAGERAEFVRTVRIDSARHVIELANREQAAFVVLAGDTFDHNTPERDYVSSVYGVLASAACPVLVLPGNHDRLEPGSVWFDGRWQELAHVVVMRD